MKKNIIPLLLLFYFSSAFLFAQPLQNQTYRLLYRFVDKDTKKPIDGVSVRILNASNNSEQVTLTGKDGETLVYLQANTTFLIRAYNRHYFSTDTIRLQTQKLPPQIAKEDSRRNIKKDIRLEKIKIGVVRKLAGVYFSPNSSKVPKNCTIILKRLAYMLRMNPNIKLEIAAHTDSRGEDTYNFELTKRQANSIKRFLIAQGIAENRIKSKGFGENQLINQCKNNIKCTSEEHLQNRRIEYVIIGIK